MHYDYAGLEEQLNGMSQQEDYWEFAPKHPLSIVGFDQLVGGRLKRLSYRTKAVI